MSWTDFLVGLALGSAVGLVAFLGAWLWLARVVRSRRASPADPASGRPPAASSSAEPPGANDPPAASVTSATVEAAPPSLLPPVDLTPGGAGAADGGTLAPLSQRVLQHLARHGGANPPTEAATQRGILTALHVSQGALSSVLRRLEDGGAVASDKVHLRGRDRRVKVYALTPRGRAIVSAAVRPLPAAPPPAERRLVAVPNATPAREPS